MLEFCLAEPKAFGLDSKRRVRNSVLVRCFASLDWLWRLFTQGFSSPTFWAGMVFGQSVFGAEVSLTVGTFEGKSFLSSAVLAFHSCLQLDSSD